MTERLAILTDGPGGEPITYDGEYIVAPEVVLDLADSSPPPSFLNADEAAYLAGLQALLPRGWAWPRREDSNLAKLVAAIADGFARLHRGITRLLVTEADPRSTLELLPEWERMLGLPDECIGIPETLQERRLLVTTRYTATGGQSRAYFIELASSLGYSVTIEEGKVFRLGLSRLGADRLNHPGWAYAWTVHAPTVTVIPFRLGQSTLGERLKTFGNARLECSIRRAAPAHTIVHFAYGA